MSVPRMVQMPSSKKVNAAYLPRVSACLSVCLSVRLRDVSGCLSACLSVCLSLSIYLSIRTSSYLTIDRSVYLSEHPLYLNRSMYLPRSAFRCCSVTHSSSLHPSVYLILCADMYIHAKPLPEATTEGKIRRLDLHSGCLHECS